MISFNFLLRILRIPGVILSTTIQYFTIGTIYTKTNREFNTLYKNVHLAVENCLANQFQLTDIPLVVYQPMSKLFRKFKSNPMVKSGNLPGYGGVFDETVKSQWFVKNEGSKDVLLFFHGGGFALNCFDAQFAGVLMLYHALPEDKKSKFSILGLDYTLTFEEDGQFPVQLYEALVVFKKLLSQGFENIHLIGDSAGGNLVLTLSRFIAYPEEALKYFSKFDKYDFKSFNISVQPKSAVFISPWVQPLHLNSNVHGVDTTGDLGARTTIMGDWLIEGVSTDKSDFEDWITFTKTDPSKYMEIDFFKNRHSLCIYGSREVLRDGIESFVKIIESFGNMETHLEPGGIHDGLFYVESLDYLGNGGQLAIDGKFNDKYALSRVVDFYNRIL
ncbi:putative steryl acetyl hydrolase mug81 [[Candida] jaroonii]|uniref:Steryl acetyl hydrolase mug81 n=1 Tax=[Candida] jaroonii TaxID=467808 RepID=A0ACA9YCE1_9ASCO|nr:putative steryl acetyl hydrolase mug81 [[Candida] jaroonii]